MTARRLPVPLTFLVVVAGVIFLIIFFGAWAVSADGNDRGKALSFGFAGAGTNLDSTVLKSGEQPGLAGATGGDGIDDDSWWESAFLKACPFH